MPLVPGIILSAAGVLALSVFAGMLSWRRRSAAAVNELLKPEALQPVAQPAAQPLPDLPACVERYLRFALPGGLDNLPTRARLSQSGSMPLGGEQRKWSPFTARQHVTALRPGFVWLASFNMGPLPLVFVRDSYIAGEGATLATLLGLVRLADSSGSRKAAEASLMRWLAEGAWLPTALLPRDGGSAGCSLAWSALADERALAHLRDREISVELEFRFNDAGEIASVHSAARHRQVGKSMLPTPWEGRFSDYALIGGMMIPRKAEVGWIIDGHYQPYWRGQIEEAVYSG